MDSREASKEAALEFEEATSKDALELEFEEATSKDALEFEEATSKEAEEATSKEATRWSWSQGSRAGVGEPRKSCS